MNKFDEVINRKNTNSLKHDFALERKKPEDALPLWVADMDFRAPKEVLLQLQNSIEHGIFGYSQTKEEYSKVIINWFSNYFNYTPKPEWLIKSPGVVFAISAAIRGITNEGDSIMIQTPVYYPFANVVKSNKRKLVENELVYENGTYKIDFDDFEDKIKKQEVKLFILCSPHNPVGRVWTREELTKISEICLKHKVFVVSDEIHCDFVYEGNKHIVYATLSKEAQENSIICTSPSKTFNLAGLQVSNIFIPDGTIRKKVHKAIFRTGYDELNTLGLVACKAAYESGGQWLVELKEYLNDNLAFVKDFLENRLPQIKLVEPEGTYLLWLDCSGLGLSEEALEDLVVNKAKLWLDSGSMFGSHSGQFERINMTCPKSVLEEALMRLEKAIQTNIM